MKRISILVECSMLLAGFALAGQPDKKSVKKISVAELMESVTKHTGGFLTKPGTNKGAIWFVDTQEAASTDLIRQCASDFGKVSKIKVETSRGAFSFPMPKIVGEASLFVVDMPNFPTLLSAPENKWVAVNVAPLKTGAGSRPQYFEARVRKELMRGAALLSGAQSSGYPNSLMGSITSPEQLDAFPHAKIPVDVVSRYKNFVEGYGIIPAIYVPYEKACREGWAPMPTNDVQKAVWEKVKTKNADAKDPTARWKRDFPGKK